MDSRYHRLESGAGWLLNLVGLGAQYMTTGFSWLGLALSLLGVAVLLHRFWSEILRLRVVLVSNNEGGLYEPAPAELLLALALIPFAILIPVYVFFSSYSSFPVVAAGSSTTQMNVDSPGAINALGDVNIDRARRITKEDEFIRALRAVGPVTIGLEAFEDRDALFLYGQLYKLLESSQWTANERATVSGQSWVGVHVVIQKDTAVPRGAIEMVKQLRTNGIASGLVPEQNPTPFERVAFIVRIGLKPPNNNK